MTKRSDDPGDVLPLLYSELADWWPLMSAPGDYQEEAGIYAGLLEDACDGLVGSLLELGSGGGNNASHLKRRFDHLVLTDLSPGMLDVSRSLNPECDHRLGDMRSIRLGRTFDAIFVHDAVCYMVTELELRQVMETAWVHCRPGGAVLFAPDYLSETFLAATSHGGHDEVAEMGNIGNPRGLRYVEWVWDPNPEDTKYVVDYAYLLRDSDGTVRVSHDRHSEGLFARERWLNLLADVGFTTRVVPLIHPEVETGRHEMFVGRRPTRR